MAALQNPLSQTLTTEVKHLLGLLDPANHAESSNNSVVTWWQDVLVHLYESCCCGGFAGGFACERYVKVKRCACQNNHTAYKHVPRSLTLQRHSTHLPPIFSLSAVRRCCVRAQMNEV